MSDNTAYWEVTEEYWSDDTEDLRGASRDPDLDSLGGPVERAGGYRDYGAEIEASRPAKGERDLI